MHLCFPVVVLDHDSATEFNPQLETYFRLLVFSPKGFTPVHVANEVQASMRDLLLIMWYKHAHLIFSLEVASEYPTWLVIILPFHPSKVLSQNIDGFL